MYFVNFTGIEISQDFFEKILEVILDLQTPKEKKEIGVILVGIGRIKNLNKRFRGINKVTEVLAFSLKELEKPTKKELQFIQPKKENLLGEVILCPFYIKKQARRFKKSFKEELAIMFIHGTLHLFGYEHKDTKTTKEMQKIEKEVLEKVKNFEEFRNFNLHV